MGILGWFGRGSGPRPKSNRCMECGMMKGVHTDWCSMAKNDGIAVAKGPPESAPADAS